MYIIALEQYGKLTVLNRTEDREEASKNWQAEQRDRGTEGDVVLYKQVARHQQVKTQGTSS